jgi:hypothetical protein
MDGVNHFQGSAQMKKSLVMAAASAFAAGTLVASAVSAQTAGPTFGGNSTDCKGINACKGQSACKSSTNSCKGQNACKGKGWVLGVSSLDCLARGGSPPP